MSKGRLDEALDYCRTRAIELGPNEGVNSYMRDQNMMKRHKILFLLGGRCRVCLNGDHRVLEVDHINGDGYKVRQIFKSGYRGQSIDQKLKAVEAYRTRFQLLCANCHRIKTHENGEYRKCRATIAA